MFINEVKKTNVEVCEEIMNNKDLSMETKIRAIQALGNENSQYYEKKEEEVITEDN